MSKGAAVQRQGQLGDFGGGGIGQTQAVDPTGVADPVGGAVGDPAVQADQALVALEPTDPAQGLDHPGLVGGEGDQPLVGR